MLWSSANFWNRLFTRNLVLWAALLLLAPLSSFADQSVTLTWSPSPNTNVAGYKIYYGGASRTYTNTVTPGNVTNLTISGLSEGATYYFGATTVDSSSHESDFSNEAIYSIPPPPSVNQPPTLDRPTNLTIYQNAAVQTVLLNNINSGLSDGNQNVTIVAGTSDPTIIPMPTVNYTSGNNFGSLTFAPVANALGTATVTVTVNNGGANNNLTNQTFTVTVIPVPVVNTSPTLDPLANLTIYQNAGVQTVFLTNINSGLLDGNQNVSVSARTSDPTIIPVPAVSYTNGNNFGSLTFAPVANATGTAAVTVTVNNGSANHNLTSQAFTVTVLPLPVVNLPPTLDALTNVTIYQNAGLQTVSLKRISSGSSSENQNLVVSAVSSNPVLIPTPTVNYASPNSAGSLTFLPAPNSLGTALVTVTVNDGGASSNIVTQTFTVTVVPSPVVNQAPSLDPIANLTLAQNAAAQTIKLTGIAGGWPKANQIRVSASSSNPRLVPPPTVRYTSPASTASLMVMPAANGVGVATITVTVNNGSKSNNFVRRSFSVTVLPNQPPTLDSIANVTVTENAAVQTVTLTGITSGSPTEHQRLRISASSSNPRLIPAPQIQYTSPANTALLAFKPAANRSGMAIITVTVNDGARNNNIIRRSFMVTVVDQAPVPAISSSVSDSNTAAILSPVANTNGRFSFEVSGLPGGKYVVQATSDLVHWTSVQTNTAPFLFQDASANSVRQRFYRTYYLP